MSKHHITRRTRARLRELATAASAASPGTPDLDTVREWQTDQPERMLALLDGLDAIENAARKLLSQELGRHKSKAKSEAFCRAANALLDALRDVT